MRLSVYCIFFFSSRRRHTRYIGDWSSDVCSSDLLPSSRNCTPATHTLSDALAVTATVPATVAPAAGAVTDAVGRSEERRVGKEKRTCGEPRGTIKKADVKQRETIRRRSGQWHQNA